MNTKSYRRIFASPAHSGFSKGNLGLCKIIIIIGTSVCDRGDSITISTLVMAMEQWKIAVDLKGSWLESTEQSSIFLQK